MSLTIPHGKPPLKLHWVGAIPRSYPYFSQGKMKGSQKSQHPIRAVATVRRSSHGTLLCELGPLMESWVRWSQSGNGEALSSCQQQNCLKARWGHSSAKLAVPHPSLAGTTPVSPDSPANVIISDKRLIGRCTMPFPLIKEHLGKTRIATKHCQQSNQQQQLAVSSPSWAEPCAGSRACGFPHHQDSRGQGQQALVGARACCPSTVSSLLGWGGYPQLLCLCAVFPWQWRGALCRILLRASQQLNSPGGHPGCSLPWITLLLCLEQLYPLFNIYRQFVFLSFVRASRFQYKWLLPFLSSHYKITMYATKSLNSRTWEKYIKKQA